MAIGPIPLLANDSVSKSDQTNTGHAAIVATVTLAATAPSATPDQPSSERVAPGESLPFSVKLFNFGSTRRVDVHVVYRLRNDQGLPVYQSDETVAVDTTASFLRYITVPSGLSPGTYSAETDVQYPGQETPARSSFQFSVERKIAGFFVSDILMYGGSALLMSVIITTLALLEMRRRDRQMFPVVHDYSTVPRDERVYYEILGDAIAQMRIRAGDAALAIATTTPGLVVDARSGKVLKISDDPAKVVSSLVRRYNSELGKHVNFSFRKKTDSSNPLSTVQDHTGS